MKLRREPLLVVLAALGLTDVPAFERPAAAASGPAATRKDVQTTSQKGADGLEDWEREVLGQLDLLENLELLEWIDETGGLKNLDLEPRDGGKK